MKVLKNINVLKRAISTISNLGFVPTMGELHQGHITLIKKSKKKCKKTLVSIYVNPKQFNNKSDFFLYPRNIKKDLDLLKQLKVDFVFLPSTKNIYSIKTSKKIKLNNSQKILCGKFRKGHFEGVLEVMHRFTILIKPKYIFMGEKDFQQLYLVKNFIEERYSSKVFPCKTVRNKNKVALSSRNNLLSKKDLVKAGLISQNLLKLKANLKKKSFTDDYLNHLKKNLINKFKIKIEYLEIRNEKNLKKNFNQDKYRLFIAYYISNIRLIDNF
jgi:pantoate--beta-alanine ligase